MTLGNLAGYLKWVERVGVKYTWCSASTETVRPFRDRGKGVWRWGEKEIIYLSQHCHHQNDFCMKMGSDESHFNVS